APATAFGTVVNAPPAVIGLPTVQVGRDDTIAAPFRSVRLADPDEVQMQTVRVTVGAPANGVLTQLGQGTYDRGTGVYTVMGRADDVSAAIAALRFVPTRHQAAVDQRVATDFIIGVQDSTGAMGAPATTRIMTVQTNAAPVIRNAAACHVAVPGAAIRPFAGLLFQDADVAQVATLTIALGDPAAGTLTGTGPGRYDPATGRFTSTGTVAALTVEASRLAFTAGSGASAGMVDVVFTIDDGAGGVARDTATIEIASATVGAPRMETDPVAALFIGSAPTTVVAVAPASASLLTGTAGRDAYFLDTAGGAQSSAVTGFVGGDLLVLWGFRAGISRYSWSDDGLPGQPGRTIQVDGRGGVATSVTFVGQDAADTDRFAISSGRVGGLDYLAIAAP
ncbi:MAG: hypothetical protein H7Z10_10380, partial [Gemmatimonadaceae bacterium]|nr:hypothetical protein [Acetobacteraceae bacterium]